MRNCTGSLRARDCSLLLIIGLTGGIGMGKSTVARMFARLGVPGFNADEVVHELQAPGGLAIPALGAAFPDVVKDGVMDRAGLRAIVFSDAAQLRRLEAIMHPLVRAAERKFRLGARRAGRRAILLDIPLLFESGGERRVDVTVTVSAPRDVQMARVRRRGLADGQIEKIIRSQMADQETRRRADFVVPTGLSKFQTMRAVRRIYAGLAL